MLRVTLTLTFAGEPKQVERASGQLADLLSEVGFIYDEDWEFVTRGWAQGHAFRVGVELRTAGAVRAAIDLLPQIKGAYLIESNPDMLGGRPLRKRPSGRRGGTGRPPPDDGRPNANRGRQVMAKQTKKTEQKGPRWSIGLYRNDKGGLSTCYVSADGTPMPYEQKRVGGRKILFHAIYSGMLYREARQELLKDAAKKGIKAEAAEPKAEAKPVKKAPAAKAKKATKRASKPKKPAAEPEADK